MQEEMKAERDGIRIDAVLQIEGREMPPSLRQSIARRGQEVLEVLADDMLQADATIRDTDSGVLVILGIESVDGAVDGRVKLEVHVEGGLPEIAIFSRLLYNFQHSLARLIEVAIRFDEATRQLVCDVGAGLVGDDELRRRLEENRTLLGAGRIS